MSLSNTIVTLVLSLAAGVLIGYYSRKVPKFDNSYYESLIKDADKSFKNVLINEINKENMIKHLKY